MRLSEEEYEQVKKRQLKNKRNKIVKEKGGTVRSGKQERMTASEYRSKFNKEDPDHKPKNKMGNVRTESDGIKFDSKLEASYYEQLKLLEQAGIITEIKVQPRYLLQEGFNKNDKRYQPIHYVADFEVYYKDGTVEVVECKGYKTALYKIKEKLFEYKYPDKKIVEIRDEDLSIY